MTTGHRPAYTGRRGRPEGSRETRPRQFTTSPPSFHQLVAEHERHTLWRYSIRDLAGELVMVSSEPITRAEAEQSIRSHFGDRLLALRPGGEQ